MKLLLTLLALLTGFAGGDVARHAPAAPAALGAAVAMAEAAVDARVAQAAHLPQAAAPTRLVAACNRLVGASLAVLLPGVSPRGMRALE